MRARNRDVEKTTIHAEPRRRGSSLNSFLAGAATILVLLLGAGGYLLYRAMEEGVVSNPFNPETNTKNDPILAPSNRTPASGTSRTRIGIKPGQFALPAFGDKARVELLSVKEISGKPDEVSVQIRAHRLGDNFLASDTINVGSTTARNSGTYDFYEAVEPTARSSGEISLANVPAGQSVDGYVVLKVPPSVSVIDIVVENAGEFKNVPIAAAGAAEETQNTTVVNPSSGKSAPGTNSLPTPQASLGFQPGQFVKLAYGNKAQVELLSLQRIRDPQTANRDVVNVQMRIRRQADDVNATQIIGVGEMTARNPETTETYKALNPTKRSTGPVVLSDIRKNASVDAYVWLKVPEGVKTLNIYLPETAAFDKVPIAE